MAMTMIGEVQLPASREAVWAFIVGAPATAP